MCAKIVFTDKVTNNIICVCMSFCEEYFIDDLFMNGKYVYEIYEELEKKINDLNKITLTTNIYCEYSGMMVCHPNCLQQYKDSWNEVLSVAKNNKNAKICLV
jgi:hypothetical protein